ncbi:MAG: hypothetical protein APF76_02595 [Desulfitibacter sp. BRH_c19]|nr:MAG: hypothetical protein APF76_02595 [Desulfitibacter sp. BRH_c19]
MNLKNKPANYINYFLTFILIISLLTAGYLAVQRMSLEAANKNVEVSIESQEVERLARYSPDTEQEILNKLKQTGVSGILLKEQIISDLEPHSAWVLSGSQILLNEMYIDALGDNLDSIYNGYNYIITNDPMVHYQIKENLSLKVHGVHIPKADGSIYFVGVPITRAELSTIGIGFDQRFMEMAVSEGYNLLVQIRNWPQSSPEAVRGVFEALLPFKGNITTVLFNDFFVPGFPDYLHIINEGIESLDANFAFIETFVFNQLGARQIGLAEPTNVVRLHSIGANEMVNMSPQRALDRLTLSVTDRNVRVLLVRLFFPLDTSDWLQTNINFLGGANSFSGLIPTLEKEGFSIGQAQSSFPLHVTSEEGRSLLTFLTGLGVISAGIILMRKLDLNLLGYILGGVGLLVWSGSFVVEPLLDMAIKAMALASVVVFPTLAVITVLNGEAADSIVKAVFKLVKASLISLTGALIMVGLFAHLNFMLKLDQFVGVKIAHLLPILILTFAFYFWMDREYLQHRIKALLNAVVTNKYLIIVGFFAVAGLIYLTRTGNEAVAVSSLELQMRTILDDLLIVRPRTKEFLIGHPIMLLLFYFGYQHRYLPLLLLGVIGQISMVNTFAHIHTPLVVSLLRTVNGLGLGIILGIVLILLWKTYKHFESRLFNG